MTIISAATIQVQIIELVTGNPRTVKMAGGACGTPSVGVRQPLPALVPVRKQFPAVGGADDCAPALTARTAAMNAKTKMI